MRWWRGKLTARCPQPDCQADITEVLEGRSVHIPVYGAKNAGKTRLLQDGVSSLIHGHAKETEAEFFPATRQNQEQLQWVQSIENGWPIDDRTEVSPTGLPIAVRREGGLRSIVYFYDTSGASLLEEADTAQHGFVKHASALVIVIDAASLCTMVNEHDNSVMTTIDSVKNLLERYEHLNRITGCTVPVAFVFTRVSQSPIMEMLQTAKLSVAEESDWLASGEDEDRALREWLKINQPVLFQQITTQLMNVRFFANQQSVEGVRPAPEGPATGALTLMKWLLAQNGVYAHPARTRALRGLGAAIAYGGIIGGVFLLPLGALLYALS